VRDIRRVLLYIFWIRKLNVHHTAERIRRTVGNVADSRLVGDDDDDDDNSQFIVRPKPLVGLCRL
jgi:hypothetical protein